MPSTENYTVTAGGAGFSGSWSPDGQGNTWLRWVCGGAVQSALFFLRTCAVLNIVVGQPPSIDAAGLSYNGSYGGFGLGGGVGGVGTVSYAPNPAGGGGYGGGAAGEQGSSGARGGSSSLRAPFSHPARPTMALGTYVTVTSTDYCRWQLHLCIRGFLQADSR